MKKYNPIDFEISLKSVDHFVKEYKDHQSHEYET